MSLEKRDGFNFLNYPDGKMFLSVDSDRLRECVDYCRSKPVQFLHLSPYHGFCSDNTEFLAEFPHVIGLHSQGGAFDLTGLYHLSNLEYLSGDIDLPPTFDISRLHRLSELGANWHPWLGVERLQRLPLKRLSLRKYKPIAHDLTGMAGLRSLEYLRLVQPTIVSLAGIQGLGRMREFQVHYASRLRDILPITALSETLERLRLDHCKNIEARECVVQLMRLKYLSLSAGVPIPSIAFIRQMPGLEFFAFVNTNVLDGDMTPLLGLSYAGFLNKRHYSHSAEEIDRLIQARQPPPKACAPWSW
jgi:protein phosphatase 1 regulatory subunit 7